MNLLLDTHAFIWFVEGDLRTPVHIRELIREPKNTVHLSIASVWEMSIKYGLGSLKLTMPPLAFVNTFMPRNSVALLSISLDHATAVSKLPLHHRDPFDRLLAVQCLTERLTIVSRDPIFDQYGVDRSW